MPDEPGWEVDAAHEEFRASVRAFAGRHVRPVAEESEQAAAPALLREMGAAGLLGLAVPEEDGGGAGDSLAIVILAEERPAPAAASRSPRSSAPTWRCRTSRNSAPPAQRAPLILSGLDRRRGHGGPSRSPSRVLDRRRGREFRRRCVEGQRRLPDRTAAKMFITNAGLADVIIVAAQHLARSRHPTGSPRSWSTGDNPGPRRSVRRCSKLGWHAS